MQAMVLKLDWMDVTDGGVEWQGNIENGIKQKKGEEEE